MVIHRNGSITTLVSGLERPTGLAFDLAGYLYAADEGMNAIVRISGFPQGRLQGAVRNGDG